jgi:putative phosphoribosyl transferase
MKINSGPAALPYHHRLSRGQQPPRRDEMMFSDRAAAGRQLAERLAAMVLERPVVLALPRGGVPVGFAIAQALRAPLDLVLVRKLGAPDQPELALGAVVDGSRPEVVLNDDIVRHLGVPESWIEAAAERQLAEIERRRALYFAGRARVPLAGRTAIVVDDGIATGATMEAALHATRRANPKAVVLAVPVAPPDTLERLRREVDHVVCLAAPAFFPAVGAFYTDFAQVEDETVADLLARAAPPQQSEGATTG